LFLTLKHTINTKKDLKLKKSTLFYILSILFSINLHAGVLDNGTRDPQLSSALDLTCACKDDDTAFIACLTALEKHKDDKECILFIKELMVSCPISNKFEEEMQFAADYVTKKSAEPLYIGIAWFRKAENAYQNYKFNECISFCDIALINLMYDAGKCDIEDNISMKCMFEMLALVRKKQCFEYLEQPTKIKETEKDLMKYPVYVKYIHEKCK